VHSLCINSFIPLSKQPTAADVQSVLPLHEHMPTGAFSSCW